MTSGFAAVVASALFVLTQPPVGIPSLPPLDDLEPAVAEHLLGAHRDLESATTRLRGRELGEAYGSFAQVLHAYESFELAEAAYLEAARLAPAEPRWKHLLGYLYQQTGRLEAAAEQFLRARALHAGDSIAAARLAEVYLRLNRLREARDLFQELVDIFPAIAQSGLGEIALRERRFRDALRHFDAVLDRVPAATSVHYSIAMAYRGLGQLPEAESHLARRGAGGVRIGDPVVDRLPQLVRGLRGPMIQGQRAYEAGRLDEAVEAFGRAVAGAGPNDEQAIVTVAILLADRARFTEAIGLLDDAHRRFPAQAATATTLSRLLASSPDRTVRDGARALRVATAVYDAAASPAHAETVALALAELNRCAEARDWMQRAIAAAEKDGDASEATRLTGELHAYPALSCRRP